MSVQTVKPGINLPHLQLIQVPGGTFAMGSKEASAPDFEKPVHRVTVADFELAAFLVTQALWEGVMGEGSNPSRFAGPRRPVEQVSWYDAVVFCNRLNVLLGQACCYFSDEKCTRPYALAAERPNAGPVFYRATTGAFRLPTEAEWEYAARGGPYQTPTEYAGSDRLKDCAWYDYNSGSETQPTGMVQPYWDAYQAHHMEGETQPTGLLQPNALGLYEMSGNIEEWCWDWCDTYTQAAQTDPSGPKDGIVRVIRGGDWYTFNSRLLCVSYRSCNIPDFRSYRIGFRLARHLTL